MSLQDQSGVTGGGLDPCNVHALFVNMDNMWTERFGNYDCLVSLISKIDFPKNSFAILVARNMTASSKPNKTDYCLKQKTENRL